MMTGVVRGREARIRLQVRGPRGRRQDVEAVIDTGYTAWLALPPALVALLGLTWQGVGRGILADGTETLFDVYRSSVVWHGRSRRIVVAEAGTIPLVGMALLTGSELKMQVRSNGKVTVKALSKRRRV